MYKRLSDSIIFYREKGFVWIDAPWLVDRESSEFTIPSDRQSFSIRGKDLVGSGEQSFIQMMRTGELKSGSYVCCTPCFRDEPILDDTHKLGFMKTEIIDTENTTKERLLEIVGIAKQFFQEYLEVEIVKKTETSFDIEDLHTRIELGSYAIKQKQNLRWICGTGCAEPRLGVCLKTVISGYHIDTVAKREVGTYRKILEEVDEFTDAILAKNPIMSLVELSDTLGAIELYLKKHHPSITILDLLTMSRTTQRAFLNGRR